ncbi:Eco57I restriction-modification methylase domain-containing protein [Halostreptopolyspora alba]|uniref:site-specific DNA-methyltransferase (adenine-specific) n=1 Tax=Halostreptopolyspora alba TaxID=2487137 RepID=A0A3N0E5A2_9ACTN|nr:class I SAM-dependent DNA methyltransferase [Nocardiopsaceae bacterium YIM 96095]
MSYDSLVNRGDYFSAHYLAEVLPKSLKKGLWKEWDERERQERERRREGGGRERTGRRGDMPTAATPRSGLRALKSRYFDERSYFAAYLEDLREGTPPRPDEAAAHRKRLHELHRDVLAALGFTPQPEPVEREFDVGGDEPVRVPLAHSEPTLVAVECGWAPDTDAALDTDQAGRLLEPVDLGSRETITTGTRLASWLLNSDPELRYVLILAGGVVILADQATWGEGRYLAASLDIALGRGGSGGAAKDDAELGTIAALFGADTLLPPEEGGTERLSALLDESRQHAVGVSADLREGLRDSVEIIANEVLSRLYEQGVRPSRIPAPDSGAEEAPTDFAGELARESLRYLYRILFLLYAEARPELGVVPADDESYVQGYSMARLGDLVVGDLVGEESRTGTHLYESLDLLFRMVNEGHRPRGAAAAQDRSGLSEGEGLRFEALRADLFDPDRTRLIGDEKLVHPDYDPDDPASPRLDTRLRNEALYKVLRLLMLSRGRRKERGGFISYAQLGINQLGAVYEGLMSYTGFIAEEELYEVAKNGDRGGGSWLVPGPALEDYPGDVRVFARDEDGHRTDQLVRYRPGAFVYRLAGRDRETSASYYTPESLTRTTVQLTLRERLDQDGETTPARELLDWTICEPALGSGAFLNEAINQVAEEYLRRRRREVEEAGQQDRYEPLTPENFKEKLQAVKAYIALHNSYGVDLNTTAVELAEVSLWLNVMHPGMRAPWFGLHLRRGNSLVGCGRRTYAPGSLTKSAWLKEAPEEVPLASSQLPEGHIHHFLLPARGWGAVADERDAKQLAPDDTQRLKDWRKAMRKAPGTSVPRGRKQSQVRRLQGLARRVEYLWELVVRRLQISEWEISRRVDVWGADDLSHPEDAVPREEVLADLTAQGTPYWRLKTLMDAWCALWFWPVERAGLLDGSDEEYRRLGEAPDVRQPGDDGSLFGGGPRAVPLADLDAWLEFAEALVGRADVPEGSLVAEFGSLADLDAYEDELPSWTGMEDEYRLPERFPWLKTVEEVARRHGFFHWELQFAHVFTRGGFDVQVGNPPWVRPRWDEDAVLAENDPWFKLSEKAPVEVKRERKRELLEATTTRSFFLDELAGTAGMSDFLSDEATYPLMAGTQPDLYRAFMCRVWGNLDDFGNAGLIHPDTHFGGNKEARLRGVTYQRLRFHAHFYNRASVFPGIHANTEFGIHVYGNDRDIAFQSCSWLFSASSLVESLSHDGVGAIPGIKHEGKWDVRPHRERIIEVNQSILSEWQELAGLTEYPVKQTPLLYPVTTSESEAIRALARYRNRVGACQSYMSRGYDEAEDRWSGRIAWCNSQVDSLDDVILQGPHFSQATPFSKQPNIPCSANRDWSRWNLVNLPSNPLPVTNYKRVRGVGDALVVQDIWNGLPHTEYFRLAWRRMIAFDTERSLFAALIPPGPSHLRSVQTLAFPDSRTTVLNAGFWASLPLDYLLRITGRSDLRVAEAHKMPAPTVGHPLAESLLLRTLRLNCLTNAYTPLWRELYDSAWQQETWAVDWPGLAPLGEVGPEWEYDTPLRTERERRAALVELDALVSVWLGIGAEELVAVYRSRYPVLADYEAKIWFDANGRKIAGNHNTYGYGQTKEHYVQLQKHLESPETEPVPEGYEAPFYKADREEEYRQAHAVFSERLRDSAL